MFRQTRGARSQRALSDTFLPVIRAMYANEGDDKGGGAGDDKSATDKGKADAKAEPVKVTLTEAELEQRINDRLAAAERKAADKAQKEQDKRDREAAEKNGEFKDLATANEKRALEAEARALAAERSTIIDDVFVDVVGANEGLSLATLREWVKPKVMSSVEADASADGVKKAAKELAEKYAKDNKPQPKGSVGAPSIRGVRTALPASQNNVRSGRHARGTGSSL